MVQMERLGALGPLRFCLSHWTGFWYQGTWKALVARSLLKILGEITNSFGGVGVTHSGQLADESTATKQQNVTSGVV